MPNHVIGNVLLVHLTLKTKKKTEDRDNRIEVKQYQDTHKTSSPILPSGKCKCFTIWCVVIRTCPIRWYVVNTCVYKNTHHTHTINRQIPFTRVHLCMGAVLRGLAYENKRNLDKHIQPHHVHKSQHTHKIVYTHSTSTYIIYYIYTIYNYLRRTLSYDIDRQ